MRDQNTRGPDDARDIEGASGFGSRTGNSENTDNPARFQASCEHLHRLGPRAVAEFVAELAVRFGPEVGERLDAYQRVNPAMLRALGADRFPPHLAAIDGGRR